MRCWVITASPHRLHVVEAALSPARFSCAALPIEDVEDLLDGDDVELVVIAEPVQAVSTLWLVRSLRQRGVATPLVVVGDRMGPAAKIELLEAGADEVFAVMPDAREIRAKVRQLLVRSHGQPCAQLRVGPIALDLDAAVATFNGRPAKLSGRLFAVLEALALRKGRRLSREQLIDIIYNGRDEPDPRAIDVFICSLRRTMLRSGIERPDDLLRTVRGQGFLLSEGSGPV